MDLRKIISKDPARAWNVLYALCTEGMDKKERQKFDSDLFRKPAGVTRTGGDAIDQSLMAGAQAYIKSLEQSQTAID